MGIVEPPVLTFGVLLDLLVEKREKHVPMALRHELDQLGVIAEAPAQRRPPPGRDEADGRCQGDSSQPEDRLHVGSVGPPPAPAGRAPSGFSSHHRREDLGPVAPAQDRRDRASPFQVRPGAGAADERYQPSALPLRRSERARQGSNLRPSA